MRAETQALLLGLTLCKALSLCDILVECDNLALVNMVIGITAIPWKLRTAFKHINKLKEQITGFQHCYREANQVADALANFGQQHQVFFFTQHSFEIPAKIKTYMYQDMIGVSNFRFY